MEEYVDTESRSVARVIEPYFYELSQTRFFRVFLDAYSRCFVLLHTFGIFEASDKMEALLARPDDVAVFADVYRFTRACFSVH